MDTRHPCQGTYWVPISSGDNITYLVGLIREPHDAKSSYESLGFTVLGPVKDYLKDLYEVIAPAGWSHEGALSHQSFYDENGNLRLSILMGPSVSSKGRLNTSVFFKR